MRYYITIHYITNSLKRHDQEIIAQFLEWDIVHYITIFIMLQPLINYPLAPNATIVGIGLKTNNISHTYICMSDIQNICHCYSEPHVSLWQALNYNLKTSLQHHNKVFPVQHYKWKFNPDRQNSLNVKTQHNSAIEISSINHWTQWVNHLWKIS